MRWLVPIALASCQYVFPLDPHAVDAPPAPDRVTGTLEQQYVHRDPNGGLAVESVHYRASEVSGVAGFSDGTQVRVDYDETGRFGFDRPTGAAYRLLWTFAGGREREIQSDLATLALVDAVYGRPAEIEATANTTFLSGTISNVTFSPQTQLRIFSTGVWFASEIIEPTSSQYAYFWNGALVDSTAGDRLVLAEVDAQSGVWGVTAAANPPIQMTAMNNVADGTMSPLTPVCVVVTQAGTAELAALHTEFPTYSGPFETADWSVSAIAGPELGPTTLLPLAEPVADVDGTINAGYASPFPDLATVAVTTTTVTHVPTPLGIVQRNTLSRYLPVPDAPACPGDTVDLTADGAAFATTLAFAGTAVSDDNLTIPLGTGPVAELTWELGDGLPGDLFTVELLEISGTTTRTLRTWTTIARSIRVDAELLAAGRDYYFTIRTVTNVPGAPQGDFDHRGYPLSEATASSGVFRVMR